MKFLTFFLFCIVCNIAYTQNFLALNQTYYNYQVADTLINVGDNSSNKQTVYICLSKDAYAFHSSASCAGLGNCKAQTMAVDNFTAANEYGRVPCCRCHSGATRCHDDNPAKGSNSGGSGSNSSAAGAEGLAIVVIAAVVVVVAAGVFLVSNEFRLGYSSSFYRPYQSVQLGSGGIFHLRKNFKNSGLEYGINFYNSYTLPTRNNNYFRYDKKLLLGGQINYLHNIFTPKMPYPKMRLFVGPTIQYLGKFALGGIAGISYQVHNRLRFDCRYEITNVASHIQFGMNILYQKEYKWQKKFKK